jgi:hypothetical protein
LLVIGRGSGLARAICLAAQDVGGKAGRFADISADNDAGRIGTPRTSHRASCSR